MNCPSCGNEVGASSETCTTCGEILATDGGNQPSPYLEGFGTTPVGIKFVCLLHVPAIFVVAGLGIALLLEGGIVANPVLSFFAGVLLLFAALSIVMVLGLWTMQSWGWKLAMGIYALGAALGIGALLTPTLTDGISLAINMMLWLYIWDKKHLYVTDESGARIGDGSAT